METAAYDADNKRRIDDFKRDVFRVEKSLPMYRNIGALSVLISRYHGRKNKKWNKACVHDCSKYHIAS